MLPYMTLNSKPRFIYRISNYCQTAVVRFYRDCFESEKNFSVKITVLLFHCLHIVTANRYTFDLQPLYIVTMVI
jgi:hypothetical protein